MRTPDADQKLDVERGAWKAREQEAGTLPGEGRRRANRRGMKLGQKSAKQPQRGLGVAQLEKLRMQEQQSKSSIGQTQYLHHIKAGGISSHHHTNSWPAALAFRNCRPPDKLFAAKELGHMMHVATRVDDMLWATFMPSPAHPSSVPLSRNDEHGHTVMSIMVPLGRDERDLSGTCNHDHHHSHNNIPVSLGKSYADDRPPSSDADHNPSNPGTSVDRLPRELRTDVPLLKAGNGNKSNLELSSVQNTIVSSNYLRSSKSCGWKRPWQALHESQRNRCLDPVAAATNSAHIALGHQTNAHQSEGFIRCCRPEDCSTHPLKISLCGTRPSEFLTLGLPSYNPGISAQHELARVQSQDANRSHVDMCSKGGDADNLQLHLCNPQQAQVQSYPHLTDESRLSCKFLSGSLTEKQMERKTEESLDLRLKLAI